MIRFRIAYIIALVLSIIAFIGTNSALALACLIILLCMMIIASVSATSMTSLAHFDFSVGTSCTVGQKHILTIDVKRPRFVPVGRVDGELVARNIMRGETYRMPFTLSAGRGGEVQYEIAMNTQIVGRVELEVDTISVYDPFALLKRTKKIGYSAAYAVYPKLVDLMVSMERLPATASSGVTYDPKRRGQDRSEPFEIRDYQPSDTMRSVHWKLSSKLDRLVVREASHPSNYDVLIFVDLGESFAEDGTRVPDDAVAGVLNLAASMSLDLLRHGVGHNVALRSGEHFDDLMVDTPMAYDDMLELLVGTPIPKTIGVDIGLFSWYHRERGFTKVVLLTASLEQATFIELSRLVDLSVIFVGTDAQNIIDESDSYALISIDTSQIEDRVRNVVI